MSEADPEPAADEAEADSADDRDQSPTMGPPLDEAEPGDDDDGPTDGGWVPA